MRLDRRWLLAVVAGAMCAAGQASAANPLSEFCDQYKVYTKNIMDSRQIGLNKGVVKRSVLKSMDDSQNAAGVKLLLMASVDQVYRMPLRKGEKAKEKAAEAFADEQFSRCQAAIAGALQ